MPGASCRDVKSELVAVAWPNLSEQEPHPCEERHCRSGHDVRRGSSRSVSSVRLELLTMEHASDLERFEVDNRAFFAAHVGDRGDAYFAQFPARLAALVAQNQAGESLCFVTVADGGAVLARVNIADVAGADGSAAAGRARLGCGAYAGRRDGRLAPGSGRPGVGRVDTSYRHDLEVIDGRKVARICGVDR